MPDNSYFIAGDSTESSGNAETGGDTETGSGIEVNRNAGAGGTEAGSDTEVGGDTEAGGDTDVGGDTEKGSGNDASDADAGGRSDVSGAYASGGINGDFFSDDSDDASDFIVEPIHSVIAHNEDSMAVAGRFLWPALAFIIPFTIHLIAFAVIDVSPFGGRTKSMMVIDNFHQYSPFLIEFRDILKNGGSLLYSWNSGLGSNYWARYAYYLASPLNLFFVFFPARSLPEFIVFLSLIRTGFSGFFFFLYSREKLGKVRIEGVVFATMYAVSAYTLAYYWNIMWFDCIALLPLIVLGLERLARGRGGVLYCIALAVAMYSNFYVALIICIFACVYYLAYIAAESDFTFKRFVRQSFRFAGYSALSAGLAAVILLPTWSALSVSQSAGAKFPTRLEFYYNALEILSGHLFNITPSVMSGKPNLYCGTAALILIPLYFLNRKFSIREKAAYGILLVFIMLSCNINYLNFLWHGMHFPNSLPYRFTFVYIFIVAALCLKTYTNLDGVSQGAVLKVLASAALYTLIMEKLAADIAAPGVLYPSLALMCLNAAAIIWAARTETPHAGRLALPAALIVMLLLTTVELTINAGLGIGAAGIGQRNNYMENIDEVREAVSLVMNETGIQAAAGGAGAEYDAESAGAAGTAHATRDDGIADASATADFYRVEFLKDTVSNTPSLYDYKGASYFSSTAILDVTDLMGKLGFRPSSAWYIYKGSTPVINSMLSLRYLLSKEDLYDNLLYPLISKTNGISIFENPYSLPLGFFVDRDILSLSVNQSNIFKIQNDYLKRSVGLDQGLRDVLLPVAIMHKESKNAEITSRSGNLYHFRVTDTSEPGFINFTIDAGRIGGAYTDPGSTTIDRSGAKTGRYNTSNNFSSAGNDTGARQHPLYLYIQSRQIDYVWYIKGNQSEGHNIKYYPYIIDMQYFGDADEIEISLKIDEHASGDFEMYACYFDVSAFTQAIDILNSRPLLLDSFSDTKLSGTISADTPGLLFTTIPYDRGWSVKLNGAKLPPDEIQLFGEGFIMINIGPGTHKVEFTYIPDNFLAGLTISLLSLAALCAIILLARRRSLY